MGIKARNPFDKLKEGERHGRNIQSARQTR
jgi:hypothetical protein